MHCRCLYLKSRNGATQNHYQFISKPPFRSHKELVKDPKGSFGDLRVLRDLKQGHNESKPLIVNPKGVAAGSK
jgi:hypothetical protein